MRTSRAILVLLLLLTGGFALGTTLQLRALQWTRRSPSDSVMKLLLGDSRRMFANHFFVKADISFHSGYYPSIFDQARQTEEAENAVAHEGEHQPGGHEEESGFLGPPTDWIDRFGRHFRVTEHTHLHGGTEREILPWLRLSADLDPQRVETYTVAAYWLRYRLGKVKEAEEFLREGLRANPDSYEILFELGRLYYENSHDVTRARNVWTLALRKWQAQESKKKEPNLIALDEIAVNLARLEEKEGNLDLAIGYFELAKTASPDPEDLQKQIDALQSRLLTAPQSSPLSP